MKGEKLPPPLFGNVITILSIDGGGVRGIISAILLMHLEAELQKFMKDDNVRIADFFDVIAGTSTGGLITAMLTAPNQNGRPLFSATEIKDFYRKECPSIFRPRETKQKQDDKPVKKTSWMGRVAKVVVEGIRMTLPENMIRPKYDGKYLQETIRKHLKETKLSQTLTNVVIPTFDMKKVRPTVFSTFKMRTNSSLDAKLSDICIGTSAAPTYLPPHYFKNKAGNGIEKEFNLIDGGMTANNPALHAISEVMQQHKKGNHKQNDYPKIFLVSLGTGFQKPNAEYDARIAASWGILQWSIPLTDFALDGSQDMVDYHLASVFQSQLDQNDHLNYLRIQTDQLAGNMARLDCALEGNLDNLENLAKDMLNHNVTRLNLDTFKLESIPGGPTNAEALTRVAEFLTGERHKRLATFKSTK